VQQSFEAGLSAKFSSRKIARGFFGAALFSIFIGIISVRADEADLNALVDIGNKAAPLRDAWEQCTAANVQRRLDSAESAEAVAQRALKSCERQETRLRRALDTSVGRQQARTIIEQLRRVHAASLAAVIYQLRKP
jgi:hypothetical protein